MLRLCNVEVSMPTAPELILDLLTGEEGALSSKALCRAGVLMGIRETTLRVGLTRLKAEGKIARGERGNYTLAHEGFAVSRAVGAWHRKQAQTIAWRGDWVAVHDTSVRRADQTAWRHHQLALSLRGFSTLRPGLRIRPDNLLGGVSGERARLEGLGLSPDALTFRLAGLDDASQVTACKLWDMRVLTSCSRKLQAALERSEARRRTQAIDVAMKESLLLGRAAISHLIRDPLLPAELMSAGPRDALLQVTRRYQAEARKIWRTWLAAPMT